ncbi:MAG TPA: heme NO-binding domain-containing protein [Thermoanaerobaculia bacterium]|nr:heme NO-binding domain-containing protein [Thermoanaerobaculia bacterium]
MHGFIISEIKKYVETKLGRDAWPALLEQAGLGKKEYENFLMYPDEEVVTMVVTASQITGLEVAVILEDFGLFIGGDLIRIYKPLLNPSWRTLDFLANVEDTIHHVVRTRNKQAKPPALVCSRTGPNEVTVVYRSARRMCALAKGIVRGVAGHYGETVEIREATCMTQGDPTCQIKVRVT